MGCDFFWRGSIPLNEDQEQAVWFVLSFFGEEPPSHLVMFDPEPELHLPTCIASSPNQPERIVSLYPYNFYGIAPHYKFKPLRDRMQFVFDRSDHGRIVSIGMTRESQDDDEGYERQLRGQGVQVSLRDGGHERTIDGGTAQSLLLNVIRMRYCPNLRTGDDYGYGQKVADEIEAWGLTAALGNKSLDFDACWDLYIGEYKKRHPEPET